MFCFCDIWSSSSEEHINNTVHLYRSIRHSAALEVSEAFGSKAVLPTPDDQQRFLQRRSFSPLGQWLRTSLSLLLANRLLMKRNNKQHTVVVHVARYSVVKMMCEVKAVGTCPCCSGETLQPPCRPAPTSYAVLWDS